MAFFDLPLDELRTYRPQVAEPADFEEFWLGSIKEAEQHDLDVRLEAFDNRQAAVDAHDVSFTGWGGTRVRAWLLVPAGAQGPLPTIVTYLGYSGGRGFPFATPWTGAGFAQLVMDTRGQGWNSHSLFEPTDDSDEAAGDAGAPGLMTRGIRSRETYYYRRLYIDALRAVQTAKSLPQVDPSQVWVQGHSQGGGLAIAATGLAAMAGVSLAGTMPDVPFLCHFERAITLTDAEPYREISQYLRTRPSEHDRVLEVLSYFDAVNFARRAEVPALFSVALMDAVCPPSTVFAAYNEWGSAIEESSQTMIKVYPHSGHEGGQYLQTWECLGWLAGLRKA